MAKTRKRTRGTRGIWNMSKTEQKASQSRAESGGDCQRMKNGTYMCTDPDTGRTWIHSAKKVTGKKRGKRS